MSNIDSETPQREQCMEPLTPALIKNRIQNLQDEIERLQGMLRKTLTENPLIAKNLRILRAQKNLEQAHQGGFPIATAEIAAGCEVTPGTYTNWETGVNYPRPDNLDKIAAYYGVSAAEITGTVVNDPPIGFPRGFFNIPNDDPAPPWTEPKCPITIYHLPRADTVNGEEIPMAGPNDVKSN